MDETPPIITVDPLLQPAVYDVGIENPGNFVIANTELFDLFQANDKYHNQPYGITKNIITTFNGQVVDSLDENTDVGNYKIYFTATDEGGNINNQPIYNVDILVYDDTVPVVPNVQPETISISNILQNGLVNWVDTEYEKILSDTIDYYDDRKSNRNIY